MSSEINPLGSLYQTQLGASRRVGEAMFSLVEKIDMALLNSTQRILLNNLNLLGNLSGARDASWEAGRPAVFPQRVPEEFLAYQKECMQTFVDLQRECVSVLQGYAERLKGGAALVETARANEATAAPTGISGMPGGRANPISGMLSFWEYTLRECMSFAQKNLTVIESSMEKAAAAQRGQTAQAAQAFRAGTDRVNDAVSRVAEAAGMASNEKSGQAGVTAEDKGTSSAKRRP